MKLASLLALVTGQRMQTFSLIDIRNVEKREKSLEIKIPDRIKTSGINRKQPIRILSFYKEDQELHQHLSAISSELRRYVVSKIHCLSVIENFIELSLHRPCVVG